MINKLFSIVVIFCSLVASAVSAKPKIGFGMSFGNRGGAGFNFAVNRPEPQPTYVVQSRPAAKTVYCNTCSSNCNESFCPDCPECIQEVNQNYRKAQKQTQKQSRIKKLRAQKRSIKAEAVNLRKELERLEDRLELIQDELEDLQA